MQPVITHWYGRSPLLWSVLVNLLGLRLLFGMIATPISQTIAILITALSVVLLIWQITGTLRSAAYHFKRYGDLSLYWLALAAIIVTLTISTFHTLDILAGPPKRITLESLRTRPLPTLNADKTTLYLDGDLDFTSNEDLISLIKQHSSITTVELNSNGGLVYAALAIALNISKNKLNTHVEKQCNSACPIAFMAGEHRTLGDKGTLGFHQYKLGRLQPLQIESIIEEQTKDRVYFQKRGVNQDFLGLLYQSDHDNIWRPDRQALLKAGVIHAVTSLPERPPEK